MATNEGQSAPEYSGSEPLFKLTPAVAATAQLIETLGIAMIALGALPATFVLLYGLVQNRSPTEAYSRYRSNLGRGILLGLESLAAADIVGNVAVDLTNQNLGGPGPQSADSAFPPRSPTLDTDDYLKRYEPLRDE